MNTASFIVTMVMAPVGVIGLILTIMQLRKKRLTVSGGPPIAMMSSQLPDMTVNYRGQPVKHPHSFDVLFTNTGRAAIQPKHFEGGDYVSLTVAGKLLTVKALLESGGESRDSPIGVAGNRVAVEPVLLNRGDSIRVQGLIALDETPRDAVFTIGGRWANGSFALPKKTLFNAHSVAYKRYDQGRFRGAEGFVAYPVLVAMVAMGVIAGILTGNVN